MVACHPHLLPAERGLCYQTVIFHIIPRDFKTEILNCQFCVISRHEESPA